MYTVGVSVCLCVGGEACCGNSGILQGFLTFSSLTVLPCASQIVSFMEVLCI